MMMVIMVIIIVVIFFLQQIKGMPVWSWGLSVRYNYNVLADPSLFWFVFLFIPGQGAHAGSIYLPV